MTTEPDRPGNDHGLTVRLLGPVELEWQRGLLELRGSSPAALLALLVLDPRPQGREQLAARLWPDAGDVSAAWLRQALWLLRRAFGRDAEAVFSVDADAVGLRADLPVHLDVRAFERAMLSKPADPARAVAAYRGELVTGCSLECFARDRERLEDLYEDALAELGAACLARGDIVGARDAALRLLARDPLREEGHALLIEVYGREGTRSQVSRQYRRLRGVLARELGVEPLPETEVSYRVALEMTLGRSAERARRLELERRVFADPPRLEPAATARPDAPYASKPFGLR